MYFSHLSGTNFRNYTFLELEFSPQINCIAGKNGQGKTNILEGIHFLAATRGFQARNERYALKKGEDFFFLEGRWKMESETALIQCNYLRDVGKKLLVDKKQIEKMSSHIGKIPIIAILPQDTDLIRESSSTRRKFIDAFIAQYDTTYLQALIDYEKALRQRKALLTAFSEQGGFDVSQMQPWEQLMEDCGKTIATKRKEFIQIFEPVFQKYYHEIVAEGELPGLSLSSQVEKYSGDWKALFGAYRTREIASCRNLAGIHRDELHFSIDGKRIKYFGSQGQQKTFVIALKLAQYELLEQQKEVAPILLLDDIFDKLDATRLEAIANLLLQRINGQIFITDTSIQRIRALFPHEKPVYYFEVEAGKVRKVNAE